MMYFKEAISQYESILHHFEQNRYLSDILKVVLPSVEKNSINFNPTNRRTSMIRKFLLFALLNETEVTFSRPIPKSTQVVFWPIQLNHLEFMLPVYTALKSNGVVVEFICERQDICQILNERGESYTKIITRNKYKLSSKGLMRAFNIIKLIHYIKRNISNSKIRGTIIESIGDFTYLETYNRVLSKVFNISNPTYHLIGYDLSVLGRAINIAALNRGLKTGAIQHGVINYNLAKYSLCDEHFLWDEETEHYYIKNNVQGDFFITGSSSSNIGKVNEANAEEELKNFFENLRFDFDFVSLIAFSGPGHNVSVEGHKQNLLELERVVTENQKICFLIKLHPKDKKEFYSDLFKHRNVSIFNNQKCLNNLPLVKIMDNLDFIITGASAASYEAFMNGIPVMSIDLKKELGHIEFLGDTKVYYCTDNNAVNLAILSITTKDLNYQVKIASIKDYQFRSSKLLQNSPSDAIASSIAKYIEQVHTSDIKKPNELKCVA